MYFEYSDSELAALAKKDGNMTALIESCGRIYRKVNPNDFSSLINSIVSQQISTKAAESIFARLIEASGGISPQNIMEMSKEELRACGLSGRKVEYIRGIASAAISGQVDFGALAQMTDAQIIEQLTALKGVGIWTVEMLLIFCLGRRDILSFNDLGIRRGLMRLYSLEDISKREFELYRQRFSPYGSIASLYLWHLAGQ